MIEMSLKESKLLDIIISLLDNNLKNISPLVVDGEWGSGKTEFCHKMINKIKSRKHKNRQSSISMLLSLII